VEVKDPGFLDLDCTPECTIEIDGRAAGFAPLKRHALQPGKHKVVARNRTIKAKRERQVDIETGKTAKVSFNLVTGP